MALIAMFAVVGCSRAESPAEVRHDVNQAKTDADKKVADARRDQADTTTKQMNGITNDANDATREEQKKAYDVAIAKAEGDAKVAKEACEGMNGDAQKACKDKADANLELAKSNAKAQYPAAD